MQQPSVEDAFDYDHLRSQIAASSHFSPVTYLLILVALSFAISLLVVALVLSLKFDSIEEAFDEESGLSQEHFMIASNLETK